MKYMNAKDILPDLLVKELQDYIQGGYLYIPASENQHRCWGEVSGYKEELRQRNNEIVEAYNSGSSICGLFVFPKTLPKCSVDCCYIKE